MALWGTKDTVYSTGKVNVNVTTGVVTRSAGTINWSTVSAGQVITVDGTAEGVIKSVDTATGNSAQLTITTEHLPSSNISNKGYVISEKPKSTLFDSKYSAGDIFGVDETEVGVARTTAYSVTHGGWVGITSYTDQHGNLRIKTETLVAMSSISGDAADDAKFAE